MSTKVDGSGMMRVGDMNETICSRVRRKASSTGRNQADWAFRIGIVESDYLRFVRHRFAHRPGPQAKFVAECVKLEHDILLHRIERDDRTAQSDRGDDRRIWRSSYFRPVGLHQRSRH